jgi:hypothetical protein
MHQDENDLEFVKLAKSIKIRSSRMFLCMLYRCLKN